MHTRAASQSREAIRLGMAPRSADNVGTAHAAITMLAPGTQLGRYTIERRLGSGGMGDVYLAIDPTLSRRVAVKVLPEAVASDPDRLARFLREARTVSVLNHPNLLTLFDVGLDGGTRFLVTEFVDGRTLRAWSAEEHPPLADILDAVAQTATALAAAHKAGVVHRDVKPENVMLRHDGLVKVLDFGLTKFIASAGSPLASDTATGPSLQTAAGVVVGTVRYMSPEQACGAEVDARSDIWSLGVVLYELVAGAPPFRASTPVGTLGLIVGREPEPLESVAPGTPKAVCRIVARALRKESEERYGSAAEMAAELTRAMQELGDGAADTAGHVSLATMVLHGADTAEDAERRPQLPPTNLPPRTSELIGRERELDEVVTMLRAAKLRLLTLTGPGGTGKTCLAVEAARRQLEYFADGVFAVDLSTLADPERIAPQIAEVFGLKESAGRSLTEELERHLADKRMLLVLDNFEHLLAGAAYVSRLLASAPRMKLLATSRALLHLRLEREYAVEPLAVPQFASLPALDDLASTPAVALFLERARQAKPSFALTTENARAVVEVCRRVEGLPLAIELAAARVKLLAPQAMLERLSPQLRLLTGGPRDLPTRQQTMRGAVAWSYELLERADKALLRRLAVFVGGATLEAVEVVCGKGEIDVLDAVGSLLDKSLLRQREPENGEMRFTMLEVVREYALEQLEESREAEAARQAHARYFLELAEKAEPELVGARQVAWLARLEAENDNLRTALLWLLERDANGCLRLAAAVRNHWVRHGHYTEGRRWLEAALERSRAAPAPVRARALAGAGSLARHQGDLAAARGYFGEHLRIGRETGDPRLIGWASLSLGTVGMLQADLQTARVYLEESLARGRELGDDRLIGNAINLLGELAREEGEWDEARERYEQALALHNHAGSQVGVSTALTNLGAVAYAAGDLEAAGASYRDALVIAQALGDREGISYCLEGLGAVAAGRRAWARAARLGGAAEALREAVGAPLQLLEERLHEGWVARLRAALDTTTREAEWTRGRATTPEEAISEALADGEG
jgi:predicted ATPase/serine/threonine protein kinase